MTVSDAAAAAANVATSAANSLLAGRSAVYLASRPKLVDLVCFVDKIREDVADVNSISGKPWLLTHLATADVLLRDLRGHSNVPVATVDALADHIAYLHNAVDDVTISAAANDTSAIHNDDENSIQQFAASDDESDSDGTPGLPILEHDSRSYQYYEAYSSRRRRPSLTVESSDSDTAATTEAKGEASPEANNVRNQRADVVNDDTLTDRQRLFGDDADHSGEVGGALSSVRRRRSANAARPTDLESMVAAEDKIAENMLALARTLRDQSQAASQIISRDVASLSAASDLATHNTTRLATENERLIAMRQQIGCRCWIVFILVSVVLTFLAMVLIIRMTPIH